MFSRKIYNTEGLTNLLSKDDENWYANESLILKIATIEHLCKELNFTPDRHFLIEK